MTCVENTTIRHLLHNKIDWQFSFVLFQREEALAARKKFESAEGDFITYLKILQAFKASAGNKVNENTNAVINIKI